VLKKTLTMCITSQVREKKVSATEKRRKNQVINGNIVSTLEHAARLNIFVQR